MFYPCSVCKEIRCPVYTVDGRDIVSRSVRRLCGRLVTSAPPGDANERKTDGEKNKTTNRLQNAGRQKTRAIRRLIYTFDPDGYGHSVYVRLFVVCAAVPDSGSVEGNAKWRREGRYAGDH